MVVWCCRHSLEELQQLVDSAVRCIEGTQETIDTAIRRKTDPVSAQALLPSLRLQSMHSLCLAADASAAEAVRAAASDSLSLVWLEPPAPLLKAGTSVLKACWLTLSRFALPAASEDQGSLAGAPHWAGSAAQELHFCGTCC